MAIWLKTDKNAGIILPQIAKPVFINSEDEKKMKEQILTETN